jgi:hypothetical protein
VPDRHAGAEDVQLAHHGVGRELPLHHGPQRGKPGRVRLAGAAASGREEARQCEGA